MSLYDDTFLTNSTRLHEILLGLNGSTNEPFLGGYLILLAFFIIFYMYNNKGDSNEVLVIDFLLTTIIALLLAFAGFIAWIGVIVPFVFFLIMIIGYLST